MTVPLRSEVEAIMEATETTTATTITDTTTRTFVRSSKPILTTSILAIQAPLMARLFWEPLLRLTADTNMQILEYGIAPQRDGSKKKINLEGALVHRTHALYESH
ncbi:uncharacterized protein N7503_010822 [Penicillium pulvis]|uniref:uncharacterized protein n=1 Tax=Penicillium pulvis TaxID=1562058 RepID=UPI002546EDBC|nr:uncharacterized protein N7503_010822 [Penicillium pulvis]KAJ5785610.1 hypothetical protein N7503_010822 [Penicillium pulvis]